MSKPIIPWRKNQATVALWSFHPSRGSPSVTARADAVFPAPKVFLDPGIADGPRIQEHLQSARVRYRLFGSDV